MAGGTINTNVTSGGTVSSTSQSGSAVQTNISGGTGVGSNVITGGRGPIGEPGVGVPAGGTTNQYLSKTSDTDYATSWADVTKVTVSDTEPVSPSVNDVWIDTSN